MQTRGQRAGQGGGGLRPGGQVEHVPTAPHPAEIVDGNLKMTLGMIWTIILRFAIQDISVEGEWWGGGEDLTWEVRENRAFTEQNKNKSIFSIFFFFF